MKALVARTYGPLESLEFTELPNPEPGPGQLLVRMEAAALNAVDHVLITGEARAALPVRHPFVPGVDVSGVIEAVGAGVTGFGTGESVIAWNGVRSGALAEYTLVNTTAAAAVRPAGLTAAQGAALPTAALTAAALLDLAGAAAGDTALVVGASGGVGSYLVQLADRAGLVVLATGRNDDQEFLAGLGARYPIDYQHTDIAQEALRLVPGGVDVVFDLANAGPALARTAAAVRGGGRLVSPLRGPAAFERGVTAVYGGTTTPEGRLASLAALAATDELRPTIGADYPFAEARRALTDFATKHIRGKVTVTF
ncbi:NADP-dependent oxidoreductase [Streptomyces roseolus]|uniref:NADP-dependent oxidoreductase n=1 Tax=Streptomyces roseolus TaxID=67358 RepID=UPI003666C7B4